MNVLLTLILSVLCACAAKPTRENASQSKVTREAAPEPIELQADVEAGPAGAEGAIITNDGVLRCLSEGVQPGDYAFASHVQAKLVDGRPTGVSVDGGSPALRGCLKGAFGQLKLEGGGKVLKVHLVRAGQLGLKGKSFRLPAPGGPKKFE